MSGIFAWVSIIDGGQFSLPYVDVDLGMIRLELTIESVKFEK